MNLPVMWLAIFLGALLSLVSASAPGDEDSFCTDTLPTTSGFSPLIFPPNARILMDSYNYINLLPPHSGAVWQQVDNDDQNMDGRGTSSYGRTRDQGKILQTFVQSVIPGSPSFMAGLYPGDTIVEVNGMDVKYAPVENVVEAIQEGGKSGERVALKVEFVDGVTRLECMQKSDAFKNDIKTRQKRLKELLSSEVDIPAGSLPSPRHVTLANDLPVWADTTPTFEKVQPSFPYNRHLNQMVAVHSGAINALDCEVLVMPISSCHPSNDKNILHQLLRGGGPDLLDDLSLAKQCKIGENISTWGHSLPAKYIYHCVFGNLEESLHSCCNNAMETANTEKLKTIVFWLDGFASLSVSPHIIIDAVRNWLQQDIERIVFNRVVFSSKANSTLVEKFMHISFPLFPSATRDSDSSFTDPQAIENGIELLQNGNGEPEPAENQEIATEAHNSELKSSLNGMDEDKPIENDDIDVSTEDLLKSLQAIEDENMKTFEELVGKLNELTPTTNLGPALLKKPYMTSSQDFLSRSLPSHKLTDFLHGHAELDERPATPTFAAVPRSITPTFALRKSQSGDLVLNPDRMESDV